MANVVFIPLFIAISFLLFFYCMYYLAYLMDWSIRTLSGNKHKVIVDTDIVCSKCGDKVQ